MGRKVTNLESTVLGFTPNLLSIHQHNSWMAPKWHAHPQKNRPNISVVKNAIKTSIPPALMIPCFTNAWKNSWKSMLPIVSLPKNKTCTRMST